MTAAVLLALQIAASAVQGNAALTVRNATKSVSVPVVSTAAGSMIRLIALKPIIQTEVRRGNDGRFVATIGGTTFELDVGKPAVRVGADLVQLAAAPAVQGNDLLVPVQFFSEIIPAYVVNTSWSETESALVMFSMVQSKTAPAPRATSAQTRFDDVPRQRARAADALPRSVATRGRRTVIVDAGHGGPDNGMSGPINGGPKLFEKNITLAVAKRLGDELRGRGVDVVYTRTTDTLIALSDRGRIANRNSGDLFISIHVNAANPTWRDPGGARGFETYFLAEARTEDARRVEQMENEAVEFEDGPSLGKDDPLSFILSDMIQNEHLRESSDLADLIQQRLGRIHPGPSRGVKQAGFRVLVTAYMPAVLVEIGFGTNAREAAFLQSGDKQQVIAGAIAEAAMEYLQRYDRRVAGGGHEQ
jgi:N-acetylmuramoyl-L-alanine amidase